MSESVPDPFKASNPDNDFIRRIRLIEGDITQQSDVDAIATSVDITLDTTHNLNRAIMQAAGQALDNSILDHIYRPHVSDVYVLPGYNLPVPYVIVAITPVWRTGSQGEDRDLLRCYRGVLEMAFRMNVATLAIPALGTGRHEFPVTRAVRLALQAIRERMPDGLQELRIVCQDKKVYDVFAERIAAMTAGVKASPDNDGGSSR